MMMSQPDQKKAVVAEEKEENKKRRQKLKSGFRICKPEGSFVWPSEMAANNQVVVHLEDLLAGCPTPPSVSSSASCSKPSPLHHHHQRQQRPSPRVWKPVATRAAVSLNFSFATTRDTISSRPTNSSTTATAAAAGFSTSVQSRVLDLNELPLAYVA